MHSTDAPPRRRYSGAARNHGRLAQDRVRFEPMDGTLATTPSRKAKQQKVLQNLAQPVSAAVKSRSPLAPLSRLARLILKRSELTSAGASVPSMSSLLVVARPGLGMPSCSGAPRPVEVWPEYGREPEEDTIDTI